MKKLKDISIKYKMFLLTIIVLFISILATSTLFFYRTNKIISDNIPAQVENSVSQTANYINDKLFFTTTQFCDFELSDCYKRILENKKQNESIDDFISVSNEFEKIRMQNNQVIDSIVFYRYSDNKPFYEYTKSINPDYIYGNSQWYKDTVNTNYSVYWGNVREDNMFLKSVDSSVFSLSKETFDFYFKQKLGMLIFNLKESFLTEQLKCIEYCDSSIEMIVDNNGNIITSNSDENLGAFRKFIPQLLANEGSKQMQEYVGGHKMLITYDNININNWNVVSFIPVSELAEQTKTLKQFSVLIILVCLLFSSLIMVFVVKVITDPISKMASKMKKVQNGDRSVSYEVNSNDEIGIMGTAFNDMVKSINTLISEVQYEKEVSTTAELRTLQEQINAHFIYNTLDSIYWLSKKGNSEKAAKMTSSFAQFLRVGLNKGAEYTTFANECEHIKNYMIIENIRYENRFDYNIHIDESIKNYNIIKLITQPLVENAILHGIYDLDQKGIINVSFKDEGEFIVISVCDNGVGMDAALIMQKIKDNTANKSQDVENFALFNIYYRIKVKYKEFGNMEINSEIGKGTEIRLVFHKKIWNEPNKNQSNIN